MNKMSVCVWVGGAFVWEGGAIGEVKAKVFYMLLTKEADKILSLSTQEL